MREGYYDGLKPDTHAIVASNLVTAAAIMVAAGQTEAEAKRFAADTYLEYRGELPNNLIFHEGAPLE